MHWVLVVTLVTNQIIAFPSPYTSLKDCVGIGSAMLREHQAGRFLCLKSY